MFLDINFITPGACNTSATRPRLITTSSCAPCVSWNAFSTFLDDLCVDIGFPGNPVMWASADCCTITPTAPGSWGRLKSIYR